MKIDGVSRRTVWLHDDGATVEIIDQTQLPHRFETVQLKTVVDVAHAIRAMQVRGAPLIGATAAYGMALAMRENPDDSNLQSACDFLIRQRPTAVNLQWAVSKVKKELSDVHVGQRAEQTLALAAKIVEDDVETCRRIGQRGLELIRAETAAKGGAPVNILTHCNAGWLACVDWGTATSPIYQAHDEGIDVHVWVDETRPRNQGAALTAYELSQHGVPHSLIVDNAGGHYMQQKQVDMVIVGTDRVASNGDVANKIGTYLKALAAYDNGIPFYVALPYSTIDWDLANGADIPIEERAGDEVLRVPGRLASGEVAEVEITAAGTQARNPGFDIGSTLRRLGS